MRVTIYWRTKDGGLIDRIRRRFRITQGMSVNGESPVTINDEKDIADLKACADLGLIQIRNKRRATDSHAHPQGQHQP